VNAAHVPGALDGIERSAGRAPVLTSGPAGELRKLISWQDVGMSDDGVVVSGWGSLARTQEQANQIVQDLIDEQPA
jgi:hypothetical protein